MSKFKKGDLVRVGRDAGQAWSHGVKFGAVCEVIGPSHWDPNDVQVKVSPSLVIAGDDWNDDYQIICPSSLKLAKQAMRKAGKL